MDSATTTTNCPFGRAPFGLLLLDRVPMTNGQTILDVGAGTGFVTIELAQRCGPQTKVFAVDPWQSATARLRRKVAHLGLDNVTVLEQDAVDLRLPDNSVDLVLSNLGLNNFSNATAVLRVLVRVLRPGGRLFLTTNLEGHMAEFYEVYRSTLLALGQASRVPTLERHVRHRGTLASVCSSLESAGLDIVASETESFRLRYADGSALLRHFFIRLGFLQAWSSIPEPLRVEETFRALEENLNQLAKEKGELTLTIPFALVEARKA